MVMWHELRTQDLQNPKIMKVEMNDKISFTETKNIIHKRTVFLALAHSVSVLRS